MKNAGNKRSIIVGVCVLLACTTGAWATKLTFDLSPGVGDWTDFGQAVLTPVYGDRGVSGSTSGSKHPQIYSYDDVSADTPNIQIDYGHVRDPEVGSQAWLAPPGLAALYSTGYTNLENVRVADGGDHSTITMFKPDTGYAVTIYSMDTSTWGKSVIDVKVQVWESIGDALDISAFVGFPDFVEGFDYTVLYSAERSEALDQHFDIEVSSNSILWLCVWSVTGNNEKSLAQDNIVFSQSQETVVNADTCAELFALGLDEETDLDGDCDIDLDDLAVMVGVWLDDSTP